METHYLPKLVDVGSSAYIDLRRHIRLFTDRLIMRRFTPRDAHHVQVLASNDDVAATTEKLPHPYPPGEAARWIDTHDDLFNSGHELHLAITSRDRNLLVGSIGLIFNNLHRRASLSYWIGKPFWNRGYATEAVRAALEYAFDRGMKRVWAMHFSCNPSSGRVMEKAGMKHEGKLLAHALKGSVFHDCEVYGIVRA